VLASRAQARFPAVAVPLVAEAALWALPRARAAPRSARKEPQGRRHAFLRRPDRRDTGRAPWSPAPLRWLSAVRGPPLAPQSVLQDAVRAVHEPTERLQRLAQAVHAPVPAWRLPPGAEALHAWRGVPGPVAVTMGAAMGDLTRFDPPRVLMPVLGMIPAEYSSGARRPQGALTPAGHTHARSALVEGAWASREPATVRRHLPGRRATLPKAL